MPELHVSTEITRFNASLLKGRPATASANITSSGAAGASNEREEISAVVASSRSTTGRKSGSSSSSTPGLVHRRSGTTAGRDDGSTENHVPGVQVSGTQRADDGCSTISADEYAILRSYWASNINVANSQSASGMQQAGAGTGGDHDPARFGRSVSTGNLPNTNHANSNSTKSSRFVHNDRLIDGSLTQSVLGGLRKVRSSEKARFGLEDVQGTNPTAICQLDRGETNTNSCSLSDVDAVDVSNASNGPTQRRVADLLGLGGYAYRFLSMLLGFMVGQRWHGGDGPTVGLSPGNPEDSNSIPGLRHNSSLGLRPMPMPLCFVVSGGKAGGRVSWMVTVLPSPPSALTQSAGTDIGSSDDLDASECEESHSASQDWRAIFK